MDTQNTSMPAVRSPLEESQFEQIRMARLARGAVRSTAALAHTSGIVTVVIAAISLLVSFMSFSFLGIFVSLGVCAVGVVEMIGASRVRIGDASACRLLGRNQLALLGVITVYCAIQIATFSPEAARNAVLSPESRSQLAALKGGQQGLDDVIDKYAPRMVYGFYGLVILISAAFQGGMAVSYFRRRKHVEAFNAQTPPWIRRVFIEAGA